MTLSDPRQYGTPARQMISRRRAMRGALVTVGGLAGAAFVGCSSSAPATPAAPATSSAPATTSSGPAEPVPTYPSFGVPVVTGTPKDGGNFVRAENGTSPEQDMYIANSQSIWKYMSEMALHQDPWTGALAANLIESWEAPDKNTYLLKLREGIKVHNKPPWNGREYVAEDLAFHMNRNAGNTAEAEGISKARFQRSSTFTHMKSLEVVDKYTVKVNMSQPSSAFLKGLAFYKSPVMPQGVLEVGFKDPVALAGVGAFQLTEFQTGIREVYTKFPEYYRPGEPHFDKFVFNVIPDRAAEMAAFITKQLSYIPARTPEDKLTIDSSYPDALFYSTPGNLWPHFRMNLKLDSFKDFRVRKALQLAANYEAIGNGYYGNGWTYTQAICSAFPEAWSSDTVKSKDGFNPATKEQDIAEAAKLLASAGYENGAGLSFEIMTPSQYSSQDALRSNSLRFQDQMRQAFTGMEVIVRPSGDFPSFNRAQSDRTFQMTSYNASSLPDIGGEVFDHYHSKGGRNFGTFENAEADSLIEKMGMETDSDALTELASTFQEKYQKEWVAVLNLFIVPQESYLQPNIGGRDKLVGPWSNGLLEDGIGSMYEVA